MAGGSQGVQALAAGRVGWSNCAAGADQDGQATPVAVAAGHTVQADHVAAAGQ